MGASFSERVWISKDRKWLRGKRSDASIEGAEAFGEKFFLECIKQGVLKAKEVFFIGDGASWIRALKSSYFLEAIGVLDLWHLERELKKALGEERAWRFKKRRMSWYRRNANPLLKLRLLKLNGNWDTYWHERRKEFARYAASPHHGKRDAYHYVIPHSWERPERDVGENLRAVTLNCPLNTRLLTLSLNNPIIIIPVSPTQRDINLIRVLRFSETSFSEQYIFPRFSEGLHHYLF